MMYSVHVHASFEMLDGSKNPFHCCLQIIDVDCLNEMFALAFICTAK